MHTTSNTFVVELCALAYILGDSFAELPMVQDRVVHILQNVGGRDVHNLKWLYDRAVHHFQWVLGVVVHQSLSNNMVHYFKWLCGRVMHNCQWLCDGSLSIDFW